MRLSPRDNAFVDLFAASARNVRDGVGLLSQALAIDADRPAIALRLKEIEHLGDEQTHEIVRRAGTAMVTPFDREDIYRLAGGLDDVLDDVEKAVDRMVLYRVGDLPAGVAALADVLDRAAELTAAAMPRLHTAAELSDYWIEINRLENQADRDYRRLLARIFSGEYDAMTVHKLKDVVDTLESAVDSFETVAGIVELIAVKGS